MVGVRSIGCKNTFAEITFPRHFDWWCSIS